MNYKILFSFYTLFHSCYSQANLGFKFKNISLNDGSFYGIGVDVISEPEYLIKGPLGNEYDISGNDGYGAYGYLGIRKGLNSYELSLGGSAIKMLEGNSAISVDLGGEYRRYLPVKPIVYFGSNLQPRILYINNSSSYLEISSDIFIGYHLPFNYVGFGVEVGYTWLENLRDDSYQKSTLKKVNVDFVISW